MLPAKTTTTMKMINFEGTMMPVATLKTLLAPMPWIELYKMSVVIAANFEGDKDKMQLVDILDELVIEKKRSEMKAQLANK